MTRAKIVLLLALLLTPIWTAASEAQADPSHEGIEQNGKRNHDAAASVVPQPLSISINVQGAEKDRGCKKGEDDRRSDLCADWAVADATRLGALVTAAGVAIAIAGIYIDRRRRVGRADCRIVGVSVDPEWWGLVGAGCDGCLTIRVRNDGKSASNQLELALTSIRMLDWNGKLLAEGSRDHDLGTVQREAERTFRMGFSVGRAERVHRFEVQAELSWRGAWGRKIVRCSSWQLKNSSDLNLSEVDVR